MIDYDFTIYNVNQINELVYRLKKMSDETERIIEVGRSGWRGESANEYYRSCMALRSKMITTSEKMKELSALIKCTTDKMVTN